MQESSDVTEITTEDDFKKDQAENVTRCTLYVRNEKSEGEIQTHSTRVST